MRLPPTYYRLRRSNLFLPFIIPFALVFIAMTYPSIDPISKGQVPIEAVFLYLPLTAFLGSIAGVIGIVIADIVPRLRWILRIKCTMRQTSIGIVILAFTLGAISWCWPEQQRKFLMPNKHQLRLQAKTYGIWYYPRWDKPLENYEVITELRNTTPAITIKSNRGQLVEIVRLRPDKMPLAGYPYGMQIGSVQIPRPGRYELSASSDDDPNFVIALVPPEAEIQNPTPGGAGFLPFKGFSDKHLED